MDTDNLGKSAMISFIWCVCVCVCTIIKSSSSATGEAGLISPSEWSDEAFLFLFFAPTRVIVLQVQEVGRKNKPKNKCLANGQQRLNECDISNHTEAEGRLGLTSAWSCTCSCCHLSLHIQPPQRFHLVPSLCCFYLPLLQFWGSGPQTQDFSSCFRHYHWTFSWRRTPRLKCPLILGSSVCLEARPGLGLWAGSFHHALWLVL